MNMEFQTFVPLEDDKFLAITKDGKFYVFNVGISKIYWKELELEQLA